MGVLQIDLANFGTALYNLVIRYGYIAIFLGLLIEGTGVPGPVQILFAGAGYFIARGHMQFSTVVAVAAAGNLIGNLVSYAVGLYGGRQVINRLGRHLGFSLDQLDEMSKRISTYGGKLALLGRLFGPLRTPTILSAGLLRLPLRQYLVYSTIGALAWSLFWTFVGVQFGQHLHLEKYGVESALLSAGLLVFGVAATYFSIRYFCRREDRQK